MRPLAHSGLALATSIASVLNLGLLVYELRRKLGSLGWRQIARSAGTTLVGSAIMGIIVWGVALVLIPQTGGRTLELLFGLSGCVITGLVVYGVFAYYLKSPEFLSFIAEAKKSIIKK